MIDKLETKETVTVGLGDRAYDIIVRPGLLSEAGAQIASVLDPPRLLALITNTKLGTAYGQSVREQLEEAGFTVVTLDVPVGERFKSLSMAEKLYGRLLEAGADRSSAIVALGGGVIGDLAGFVAATYMRGIPLVQIPTSLLAQVDSSVGGKTAVNHPQAKNIIGAFHQPRLVLVDPDVLQTLPAREFRAGLAEIIKYALIAGGKTGELISSGLPFNDKNDLVPVIAACCAYKAAVVEKDEFDQGIRAVLNYGHTIGHAIEAVAGFRQYNHGEAVAVGMIGAAIVGRGLGLLDHAGVSRHREMVAVAGLPDSAPGVDSRAVFDHLRMDKKRLGDRDRMVLLAGLGRPEVKDVDARSIRAAIDFLTKDKA